MSSMVHTRDFAIHSRLAALAQELCAKGEVPGICIAASTPHHEVEVQAGVRVAGGQEPISGRTHFHIGCIAKLLLSLVTLEKVRCGTADFDTRIGELLPELSKSVAGRKVCLAHLLSHTAGYRSFPLTKRSLRELTWDRFMVELAEAPQLFVPGTVFSYEHTGSVLVSEIIQRASGERLSELLDALCYRLGVSPGMTQADSLAPDQAGRHAFDTSSGGFRPLGRAPPSGESAGAAMSFWRPAFSNLTLSMKDVARIGRHLCGSISIFPDEPALPAAVRALVQKSIVHVPAFITARNTRADLPEAFGLGAARYEGDWHGMSAVIGGQCVALRYHPGLHVSVAVGINCARPNLLRYVARSACATASEDPAPAPWRKPSIEPTPAELEGTYQNGGGGTCKVGVSGDSLTCVFDGASAGSGMEVEIDLGSDPPVVKRGFPGAAVSFFRAPGPQTAFGLMHGLVAYRKDGK